MTPHDAADGLTLFHSPGACSLASHIALEETGAPYDEVEVSLSAKANLAPEYLAVNPRGKVPALRVGDRVLTENTAILTYVATRFPDAALLPADTLQRAECIAQMAWFSNTPHIAQRARFRPYYFADEESVHPQIRAKAAANYWGQMQEIDRLLAGRRWLMGDAYSAADPYALVFYGWGTSNKMPMDTLVEFTRHRDQMFERPAVRAVIERENNPHFRT